MLESCLALASQYPCPSLIKLYFLTVTGLFLCIENKEASDNADDKETKSMFPRPYKHKLCCLRPELIEGFIA